MKAFGLFGAKVPESSTAGSVSTLVTYTRLMEELAYGWMSLAGVLNTHTIAVTLLEPQRHRGAEAGAPAPMATGEIRAAFSLSEPDAGSETQRRCGARPRPTATSTSSTAPRCG